MKRLGKKLLVLSICLLSIFSLVACGSDKKDETLKVGVIQFMEHPSLDTIRESTLSALEDAGYKDGDNVEIIYQNGNGDTNTLDTICKDFQSKDVDVIVAIATPAAQSAANYAEDIPVIFAAVSDPVGAKLVDDMDKPSYNITGTSDEVQVDQIVDLALEMYPETKSIGYLYNSGEANSVSNLEKLQEYAKEKGLTVNEGVVTTTADAKTATQVLCEKSDIIFCNGPF